MNDQIEATTPTTPSVLLQLAIEKNLDIDKLERLLDLQTKWQASQDRKEFFASFAKFQSECPVISKNKKTDFESKQGGRVKYDYATLDTIIEQIKKPLEKYGLTYRWKITEQELQIIVTCIITHKSGHEETNTMSGAADTSGVKNAIQARGSTITYLQRYTLIGALGIATAQDDVDARSKQGATTDALSPELKKQIESAKTLDILENIWTDNVDLQKKTYFHTALTKQKEKLKSKTKQPAQQKEAEAVPTEMTDEIRKEIKLQDMMSQLNAVWVDYPQLHNNAEFQKAINDRKKEIATPTKK